MNGAVVALGAIAALAALSHSGLGSRAASALASADPEARDQVEAEARARFGNQVLDIFYEHGQWWVKTGSDWGTYDTWSVVDVYPNGLDFEHLERVGDDW
jgi:hypothetical protein